MNRRRTENDKVLVVAFAIEGPSSLRQNQHIAKHAAENARTNDRCAVYTQWNIEVPTMSLEVILVPEEPGEHASIRQMARHLVEFAKGRGIKKILVAAAAPNMEQCKRKIQRAAKKIDFTVEVLACEMEPKPAEYWIIRDPASPAPKQPSRWNIFTWFSKRFFRKTVTE